MEKQESVSRQSSILKPPKQRQPLQCVATNSSSLENSPTIKIKRRVSFAKNKRIREFCNEAEQGTVWDNTYEEHDLSNPKNNSNDHPVIISVPCDDKENFPVQLFLKNNELDCKEVPQSFPTEDGDNLSQCDMEMDNSINNSRPIRIGEQNSENQYENETIYCDDGMDMTNYIPSDIIPCQRHDNDGMDGHVPRPQSCIQNTSMEITQNLPLGFSNNLIQHQTNDKHLLASNSTDLTQAISALLSSGCVRKLNNPTDLDTPNAEPSKSTMDCSNTAAMEFTSVLPSSTWIRSNSRCQNDDRTENLTKTMEFTMAVPCSIQKDKNTDKSIGFSEKTNIFANRSMEMTEPVFTVNKDNNHEINAVMQGKTKLFLNNSMEMTQAVSIFDKIRQIENNAQPCTNSTVQEKTKIFVNNSMEMTEAVPILDKVRQLHTNTKSLNNVTSQEKTKIFVNNSMEMTEAVSIFDKIRQSDDNTQPLSNVTSQEKTKIFLDNSMEMTEAVPILNKVRQLDNVTTQEKTKIFLNNSMEMTEAIPILNKVHKLDDNTQPLNNMTTLEKTKIFLNNSMEMTEAIPILNKVRTLDDNTQPLNNVTTQEKTKIFTNHSMEMTEAVPILNKIHQMSYNKQPITNSTIQEHTKIFSNKSMEITEAVPVHNKAANQTTQEKTKIFSNHSMEITEAVPIINSQFSDVEKLVHHLIPQEKTKVFANNSMEITEAVPVSQFRTDVERQIHLIPQEKTQVFINNSMEMTELIPGHVENRQCPLQTDNSLHDITENKTKIFANKSMEITQAIAICDKPNVSSKTILDGAGLEKTKIGLNMSMEMTEAVPVFSTIPSNIGQGRILHNNTQEKTNIFLNKSMDVTETIPILSKIRGATEGTEVETRQLLSEKTKLFSNTSMEMTEAIAANRKYPDDQQTQNQTRIFANKSIDISETIPIGHPMTHASAYVDKIPSEAENEGKNISRIDLMQTSTTIPIYHDSYEYKGNTNEIQRKSNKRYRQFDFEPTNERKKISPNVPPGTKLTQQGQEVEKTKVFFDKSMDVSETIPIQGTANTNVGQYYNQSTIAQEKTKIFHNRSMDMTEVIPAHARAYEPNNLLRENLNKDRTECFFNKSMDITENIPVKQIALPVLETEKMADVDITEMVPDLQQVSATNLNNQKTRIFLDKSMDITETIAANKSNFQSISQPRNIPDEATQIFSNAPMDFTSQISTLPNIAKMHTSIAGTNQNDNVTKVFHDTTMEFTELPTPYAGTCNNSKPFNQSDFGTSSKSINAIQGSINVSNNFHKRSNYDISDRFSTRDESFHRITSDELNTLCASMNLPTQKYSRDESVNTQTNFIPSCNDVNVLRDSLQKNSMFQVPDQFNTENNTGVSNSSKNMREPSLMQVRREGTANMDLSVINRNEVDKSIVTENYFNKSVTAPVMDMDKTAEISQDRLEEQQTHCNLDQANNQNNVFTEKSLMRPMNESVIVQNTANVSNQNIKNVCSIADNCKEAFTPNQEPEKLPSSKVQIYHDTSKELVTNPLTLLTETRSNKITEPVIATCNENDNCATSRENSLTRLPSDNTDLLIATMGIKTKLTYPLIINEKTTITISNKSLTSKSYSIGTNEECCIETNKTYVVDKNLINPRDSSNLIGEEVQNEDKNFEISMVENDKECDSSDKGNNEPDVKTNIFSEKCLEELDEIQPPSFLDSDSMQDDDLSEQLERLSSNNRLDSILSSSNEQYVLPDEAELRDNISFNDTMESSKHSEAEKQKRLSSCDSDYSFKNKSNEISSPKKDCVNLTFTSVNNESKKDFVEEPISPFLSLTQSLKAEELRDDCIWAIRSIKSNVIAIDFISKSFVVIVRLNEMETINCIRDVEKIEFVSRIRGDSKNILLKIVHRLLLLKLNPDEMINKYKMYEDILPMLQYISKEVVFSMNFMFDLERLSAMNLITIDIERITFMVSSRKSNIILKVLLGLKLFDEIGPNDIDVTCVLGDIRKNDIKQLIVNIKKDYRFLSRYITDVKDYITLMENRV